MYGGFADDTVDSTQRAQTLSMLRSSAALSKMRLKRGTAEEWRLRDDLEPDTVRSRSLSLAPAHLAFAVRSDAGGALGAGADQVQA